MKAITAALLIGLVASSLAADDAGKDDKPKAKPPRQCKWREAVEGKYNSGYTSQTIRDITLDECKAKVEEDPNTKFKSIEYYKPSKICYLQLVDRSTVKLNGNDANYIYVEYDCEGNYPDECQWEKVSNKYIGSSNMVTLSAVTVDMCKEACEDETTFFCKGFNYYKPSKSCYLKLVSRLGTALTAKSASYDYYERNCYDKYRSCKYADSADDGEWLAPKRGFYFGGVYSTALTKINVTECKEACMQNDEYTCLGLAYDHTGKTCRMMASNTHIGTGALSENAAWDFYELASCAEAKPPKVADKSCKWVEPVGGYISGNDKKTLTGMSAEQCKKACENEDSFQCMSFDYLSTNKYCYLQEVTRLTHTVAKHASYDYYERDCSEDYMENCEWEPVKKNKYLSGNNLKTLTGMTPESCREACEKEDTFTCLSFDFLKTSKYCYLQRYNSYRVIQTEHASYDFYERTCRKAYKTCSVKNPATWAKPKYNRYISGNDLRTLYNKDVDECKRACLQAKEFHCVSFDYLRTSRYCYLQGVSTADFQLTTHGSYEYYEIESCGGKKPEPTKEAESCDTWVGPIKGHYMSGYDKKYVYNVASVDECKKQCEEATDFDCRSFDHYVAAKQCYLQYGDRSIAKLSASASYDYYERKCESDPYPKKCEWEPARNNRYLSGTDDKTVYNIEDPKECKTLCEDEETFNCRSFDYHRTSKFCYLSKGNMYGEKLAVSTAYMYFERNCQDQFRYCGHKNVDNGKTIWDGPVAGFYINDYETSVSGVATAEECKDFCLDSSLFHCLSFYYYMAAKTCYLSSVNRDSYGKKLVSNANYDYYEIISCPAPEGDQPDDVKEECKWLPAMTGKYISGNDNKVLYNMDVDRCKKACEDTLAFKCLSFDVYGTTCYLSIKDRRTVSLSSNAAYTYYERDCSSTFKEECEWQEPVNRRYISGNDAKTLTTYSVAECKKACEDEKDFHCVSFDYYRPSERCYLQRVDLYSGSKLSTNKDYDYYERNCLDNYRSCSPTADVTWEGPYKGHYISGQDMVTLTSISLEECKEACLQQSTFHCRSFEYMQTNKYCYLQAVTRDNFELITVTNRDYYEIGNCKPTANSDEEEKPLKYKWTLKKGYYLAGNDKKTLYNYDLEDCKKECENAKGFDCKSFDYYVAYKYCYLQAVNRFGGYGLSASVSYEYYEMDFEDGFPEDCEWQGPFGAEYVAGSKRTLTDITEEECKQACEEEDTFFCKAFTYYANRYCYLNPKNKYEFATSVNTNYIYYERNCKAKYQECSETAVVDWKKAKRGKYLNGYDLKTYSYIEVDECKVACMQETSFHCRSFDYYRAGRQCKLQAVVLDELVSVELTVNGAYDYYELETCESTEERKRATDDDETEDDDMAANGCEWVGPVNNAYLSGYDKKTLNGVTAGDCMKACQDEVTFKCKSFDYYLDRRLCYLSDTDRTTGKLTISAYYQYFELNCDSSFPDQCSWEGPVKGSYISGNDYETLKDVSPQACKDACESSCYFRCVSFDYITSSRTCYLSNKNRYTVKLSLSASYEYYERNCYHEFDSCNHDSVGNWWGPRYGKTLKGWATHQTINTQTEDECKAACQSAQLFHCQSFIYNRANGQCLLSAKSSDANELSLSINYNYYELNGCEGEAPALDLTEPKECVPDDFYVSTCSCSGDPHCLSFDGKWLHFQGTCFLTAARDNCANGVSAGPPSWEVISNPNAPTATYPVSYVRSAQVNLHDLGLTIGIYPGYATVNGVRVPGSPMYYADRKVKITISGSVYVTVKGAFQVIFSDTYLQVKVVTDMREKVCGLCGNFNGDSSDDWTIGNSHYCMSKYPNAVPGEITHDTNIMGTSWTNKIEDTDAKCLHECPNPPHPTGCENDEAFKAEDHCDILKNTNGAFKTCLAKMSEDQRKDIFDNCVYDSCTLNNFEDIVCRHAKSLARICVDQYNIKVTWRNTNFCPMTCDDNMEYKPCGDPCLPSCGDIKGENCGDLGPCGEGCFCKSGFVFDGKKCIPQSSCGCKHEELGIFINVGESYTPDDCSVSCTCESAGAALKCEDMTCSDNFVCGAQNGEPKCVCEPPYVLDGDVCVELPNPCGADAEGEEKDVLQCLTCDATNQDDCEEFGTYKSCTGEDPICRVQRTANANGVVQKVVRGCAQREECMPESIGDSAEYCEDQLLGKTLCSTCNFDLGEDDDDDTDDTEKPPAHCAEPVDPTTPPPPEDPCTLKVDAGSGKEKANRYYFDSKTKECNKFKYLGTGGNSNNFDSLDACNEECGEPLPVICELPKASGDAICDGKKAKVKKAFYYDTKKGMCKKFKYSGCGGNENNFKSKKACKKECA